MKKPETTYLAWCLSGLFLVVMMTAHAELPFDTAKVMQKSAHQERVWDGTVEAVNRATVSAQTSGRVADVLFDVDDFVEADAVIARFTNTEQKSALDQAVANLAASRAAYNQADAEFQRIKEVFARKLVSKSQMDATQSQQQATKAKLEASESAVRAAQEQYEYTVVRAPYAGIVTERYVEPGEVVNPGQPLMSGISLDKLRIRVDVPQSVIKQIRKHKKAEILIEDQRVAAESITIFPYADPASKTFRVRVELPEIETGLFPGEFVKTAFVIGESENLFVPDSALVKRSELTGLYVVKDDQVILRQVRTGRIHGDEVEILSGLIAGETIALDPVRATDWLNQSRESEQ